MVTSCGGRGNIGVGEREVQITGCKIGSGMCCATREIEPVFCNNCKWKATFKNCIKIFTKSCRFYLPNYFYKQLARLALLTMLAILRPAFIIVCLYYYSDLPLVFPSPVFHPFNPTSSQLPKCSFKTTRMSMALLASNPVLTIHGNNK